MKDQKKRLLRTGIFLIILSVGLHSLHYYIFRDLKHIFVYLLGDLAFIPLEVFIVTMVIDQLLEKRERQDRMRKMNMLIGLFFQEMGLVLLKTFAKSDPNYKELKTLCKIQSDWTPKQFRALEQDLLRVKKTVDIQQIDLSALRTFLADEKQLMINLIANPSLLEHETFSELLMAVSHLGEELALRENILKKYPNYDNSEHLSVDMERVYGHLMVQWISYIEHLKTDYPFLFTTALISNPFEGKELLLMEQEVRPNTIKMT